MKRILILLCAMIVAGSASATIVYLGAASGWTTGTVYVASNNDSIFFANSSSDTATAVTISTTGNGISITSAVTNVHIFTGNDTMVFDADSTGNSSHGILVNHTSATGVYVHGTGTIRSSRIGGHGMVSGWSTAGVNRRCIWVQHGNNITIGDASSGPTLIVDGHNVHTTEQGAGGDFGNDVYNILYQYVTFIDSSESFYNRESYDGASSYCNNARSTSGSYNVKFRHCSFPRSPQIGIVAKGGAFIVDTCNIVVDNKNTYWDTTACFISATCPIGNSTGNAYAILFRYATDGSRVKGTTISSGTQRYGGRGIMMESFVDTLRSGQTVTIQNNTITLSEGKTGESGSGQYGICRMLRIRRASTSRPLGACYYDIDSNTFTTTVDRDTSTHHLGGATAAIHLSVSSGDSCKINLRNNRFVMKSTHVSGEVYTTYLSSSVPAAGSIAGWTSQYNKFTSSQVGWYLGSNDGSSTGGSSGFSSTSDTFIVIDTNAVGNEDVVVTGYGTYKVGYSSYTNTGSIVTDGIYQNVSGYTNQASDTNIVFPGSGASDLTIKRTLSITVEDGDNDPINGATITVKNAYGNTVTSGLNTNGSGLAYPVFTYWYEENAIAAAADSIAYNPATIIAVYDADGDAVIESGEADTATITVSPTNYSATLTIPGADVGGGTQTTVLLVDTVIVNETDTARIILSVTPAPSGTDGTVNYTTINGTALSGTNYTAASGTLTIPIGQSVDTIRVVTLNDGVSPGTLDFAFRLSTLWQGTFVDNDSTGTVLITNTNRINKVTTRRQP